MTSSEDIRRVLTVLRYHDRLRRDRVPDYSGSTFEADTLSGIEILTELYERMTNSDRQDFIVGEI